MTAVVRDDLTDLEVGSLIEHERTIEGGLKTFVEVGRALTAIRDDRLYRAEYASFEAYCDERWALTARHVNRLIEAAEVKSITGPIGPANEAQARELAPLLDKPDALRGAWSEAHQRGNGRPTAATIREVVRERQAPPSTSAGRDLPPAPAPAPEGPKPAPAAPSRAVREQIDNDPDVQAAEFMRRFTGVLRASVDLSTFDAGRVAQLADPSVIELLDRHVTSVARFAEAVKRARTGLHLIQGGAS